jgi:hypothetical protein
MKRICYLFLGLLFGLSGSLTFAQPSPTSPPTRLTAGGGIVIVTNGVNNFTLSTGGSASNLTVAGTLTVNTNVLFVNTQYVGIGTVSPANNLHVVGSARATSVLGTAAGTAAYFQLQNSAAGDACYWQILGTGSGGSFEVYTAGVIRVRGNQNVHLSSLSGSVQVNNGTTDTLRDLTARSLYATNLYTTNLIVGGGATVTKFLTGTATIDFDLTAVVVQDATITVTGAALGDVVILGAPAASYTTTVEYTAWVGSADTVNVRARTAAIGENPVSGTFRATIIKH